MKMNRKTLNDIFVGLGYPNAGKWGDDEMIQKVNSKLPTAALTEKKLFTEPNLVYAKKIVQAKMDGEKLKIESDVDNSAGKSKSPTKPSSKKETPPVSKKDKKKVKKEIVEKKKKKKTATREPIKRVGILDYVYEIMKGTSKKNPITSKAVIAKVLKKFPKDTTESALKNTVTSQLSCQMRKKWENSDGEKGLNIQKHSEGGYYLSKK